MQNNLKKNINDILILGAGGSGVSAACLAIEKGYSVTLLDTGNPPVETVDMLRSSGVIVRTADDALAPCGQFDLAIYSPGIPLGSKLDEFALAHSAQQTSELAFGASFISCPVIAVTGTNGKTTTVEMLEHCIKTAGYDVIAAGNIGLPMSEVARRGHEYQYVIAEVSSFQLEHPGNFAPDVAVLLNITPDHIVRHGTMERYIDAKLALFSNKKTIPVINAETMQINQVSETLKGHTGLLSFSASSDFKAEFSINDSCLGHFCRNCNFESYVKISELPFGGMHNMENALAMMAAVSAAGLDVSRVAAGLKSFRTGDHRLQIVCECGGIRYIDDSKATNVDALIKALEQLGACNEKIALVAGGLDKACTLDEAMPYLHKYVNSVCLIGACRDRLASSWGKVVPVCKCDSMEDAVSAAVKSLDGSGIVLLSPACASQDMYHDYGERGDCFANAVKIINNTKRI